MQVDIWSDIVCPFCYLGKHQFEKALEQFEHRDEVVMIYHSFELDPHAELENPLDVYDMLSKKYGMTREQAIESNERIANNARELGLDFHQDKTKLTNSFDGHRLIHYAATQGLQAEMFDALHKAYFTDGLHIGHHDVLTQLAAEVGLDENEVTDVLASDQFAEEVRTDEEGAKQMGITGVPFFVIDVQYAISGAQGTESFLSALRQVWEEKSQTPTS